jgi:hypothetical protein
MDDLELLRSFAPYRDLSPILNGIESGRATDELEILLQEVEGLRDQGGEPGAVVRAIGYRTLGDLIKANAALESLESSASGFFQSQAKTLRWAEQLMTAVPADVQRDYLMYRSEVEKPFWESLETILTMHDESRDRMYVAQYIARIAKQILRLSIFVPGEERHDITARINKLDSDGLTSSDGKDIPL